MLIRIFQFVEFIVFTTVKKKLAKKKFSVINYRHQTSKALFENVLRITPADAYYSKLLYFFSIMIGKNLFRSDCKGHRQLFWPRYSLPVTVFKENIVSIGWTSTLNRCCFGKTVVTMVEKVENNLLKVIMLSAHHGEKKWPATIDNDFPNSVPSIRKIVTLSSSKCLISERKRNV